MLLGYVSDERYMAIADALVEIERDGQSVAVVRSSPRGAIRADLGPGEYRVTLAKDGFGSKSVTVSADPGGHTSSACWPTASSDTCGRSGAARASGRSSASTPSSRTG